MGGCLGLDYRNRSRLRVLPLGGECSLLYVFARGHSSVVHHRVLATAGVLSLSMMMHAYELEASTT